MKLRRGFFKEPLFFFPLRSPTSPLCPKLTTKLNCFSCSCHSKNTQKSLWLPLIKYNTRLSSPSPSPSSWGFKVKIMYDLLDNKIQYLFRTTNTLKLKKIARLGFWPAYVCSCCCSSDIHKFSSCIVKQSMANGRTIVWVDVCGCVADRNVDE